jgi:mono/diheme cytochrome c family protein
VPRLTYCAALMLIVALVLAVSGVIRGQQALDSGAPAAQIKQTPAPYTRPSSGKDMYLAYCASCHGTEGKGNGPAASAMNVPPTDLTQLAANNAGKFPEGRVVQTIKGNLVTPSHGSQAMPVWGPTFRTFATTSDAVTDLRIRNLTKYIASLQQGGS